MSSGLRGVSLLEVALASGVMAAFLLALMLQYRSQQVSYQIVFGELRQPGAGRAFLDNITGGEGQFLLAYQPYTTDVATQALFDANIAVEPARLRLPMTGSGSRYQELRFWPDPRDERPVGLRPGMLTLQDTASGAATISITPPDALASFSIICPELATPSTDTSNYFTIMGGAAFPNDVAGNYNLRYASTDGLRWGFEYPDGSGNVASASYAAGGMFVIDGSRNGGNAGILTGVWPLGVPAPVAGLTAINFKRPSAAKRLIFWLRMNTAPFSGLIELRESFFLRNALVQ
ncbi:MAG: hypothetical protein HY692_05140 [Cyanobacteria bacterium NC_groundwater_1444_Ag_S-0.65um_54_12]|nr:hypothetical protein [Cyanobacteria bacterium NC_groundwater_1444_Ag_S-0.65um_54_12]